MLEQVTVAFSQQTNEGYILSAAAATVYPDIHVDRLQPPNAAACAPAAGVAGHAAAGGLQSVAAPKPRQLPCSYCND